MINRWDSSKWSEISFTKEAGVFLLLFWSWDFVFYEGSQYRQIDSNSTKHKEILLGTRKISTKNWKPKHYEFLCHRGLDSTDFWFLNQLISNLLGNKSLVLWVPYTNTLTGPKYLNMALKNNKKYCKDLWYSAQSPIEQHLLNFQQFAETRQQMLFGSQCLCKSTP